METSSQLWARFLDGCLEHRLRDTEFINLNRDLYKSAPIIGPKLADVLLDRQQLLPGMVDPLLPVYAETLLEQGRISSADLLTALFKHSKSYTRPVSKGEQSETSDENPLHNPAELEYTILDVLTRAYVPGGGRPRSQDEVRLILRVLAEWMNAVAAGGVALLQEVDHQAIVQAIAVCDSFGMLSIAILENPKVIGIIDTALSRDIHKKLAKSLTSFIAFWTQISPNHVQSAGRLEMSQRNRSLMDEATSESHEAALEATAALQVNAVEDLQMMHTRPSVFIFVNALLSTYPLTDESMMMNYLHVRYGGDAQSLAMDLIIAGFDTLAAAAGRNESSQALFGLKSFLMNKVPTLLVTLASQLLTPEFSITEALARVDINVFPSFGLGMLESNTAFQEVRQDFIYSCILHGLLPSDSVSRLLGETTFDSPPSPDSRYHKDILLQQCTTEPGKAVQLVGELENLDGNAGAIVSAVVDVIRTFCATKDTMSLKSICNALSGKPQLLDLVLQFTSPASILQPLCQLLDAWRYEEDQGEYQPVYDEFASLFLLVLAFVYRYEFSHAELGIPRESFVAKYIAQGHEDIVESQLTPEQSKHLGSWVKGLFDPDGITEEVTASCRPQQFYLLVPTIFSQTMLACSVGVLGIDTIKNGLEYLSEPFLLPSLVDAIYWLTSYARENPGADVDTLLQILQRVTRAPSSGDAQAMHATIMGIVTLPLSNCLKTLRKNNPKRNDIELLLQALRPHLDFRRGPYSPCPEIATWLASQGALKQMVRTNFQTLVVWSVQAAQMNQTQIPPHYNHRLYLVAEKVLGAGSLLSTLLEELKSQTEAPNGAAAVALDIATALVCAPKTENSPIDAGWVTSPVPAHQPHHSKRLNLRDALALEFDRATDIMKKDQTMAETVVRLHRRVEAQVATGVAPLPDLTTQMPAILPDLGLTTDQTAASQQPLDFTQDATVGLDLSTADPMQMDIPGGDDGLGLMSAQSLTAEDDVFGGLDLGDMSAFEDMNF